jgi:Fur family ferric uptake transcriptional regulator
MTASESIIDLLRSRGYKMTPQRRAIVAEILATEGHVTPIALVAQVERRVPGVTRSTIYRTLDLLEAVGVLFHSHLESGAEYHRRSEPRHVHLTCSKCRAADALSMDEATELSAVISRHHGFTPDLTHFAISGLCHKCRREPDGATSPGRAESSAARPS